MADNTKQPEPSASASAPMRMLVWTQLRDRAKQLRQQANALDALADLTEKHIEPGSETENAMWWLDIRGR